MRPTKFVLILLLLLIGAAAAQTPACEATSLSAASYSSTALAPESIVSAFGQGLATATEGAATTPLPTKLAGTVLKVKDSKGIERDAPLFYVSPLQINFLIPAGTATGSASMTVLRSDGSTACTGRLQLDSVAPGFFSANANGRGVAAAQVVRVKADGSQSVEQVARLDAALGRNVSVPIDPGPETDQLVLVLYGTGIRGGGGAKAVSARMGGKDLEVLFAGPQGDFVGLDQVNLRLPRSLAGYGEISILLSVAGKPVNLVSVNLGGAPVAPTVERYLTLASGVRWDYQVQFPESTRLPYAPEFEVSAGLICASVLCGMGSWNAGRVDFQASVQDKLPAGDAVWRATLNASALRFFFYLANPVSTQNNDPVEFEIRVKPSGGKQWLEVVAIIPIGTPRWRLVKGLAGLASSDLTEKQSLTVAAGEFQNVVKTTVTLRGDGQYTASGNWPTDVYLAPDVGIVKQVGKDPSGKTLYTIELTKFSITN